MVDEAVDHRGGDDVVTPGADPARSRAPAPARPSDAAREPHIEAAPLDRLDDAALLTLTVPAGSRLHDATIFELHPPSATGRRLITRRDQAFVPTRETTLVKGDELLVVTTTPGREVTERRLRTVSRRGRLAR